jgi:hypothetical protein
MSYLHDNKDVPAKKPRVEEVAHDAADAFNPAAVYKVPGVVNVYITSWGNPAQGVLQKGGNGKTLKLHVVNPGFACRKLYREVWYVCKVDTQPHGLVFSITDDGTKEIIAEAGSASAAWSALRSKRFPAFKGSVPGPDNFGYGLKPVRKVLLRLAAEAGLAHVPTYDSENDDDVKLIAAPTPVPSSTDILQTTLKITSDLLRDSAELPVDLLDILRIVIMPPSQYSDTYIMKAVAAAAELCPADLAKAVTAIILNKQSGVL